jgi:hypothetical protein
VSIAAEELSGGGDHFLSPRARSHTAIECERERERD